MRKNMKTCTDCLITVAKEMIPGKGEDSLYAVLGDQMAVAAVFDGLGGLGARQYANYQKHSGAYMASRIASGALCDWYHALGQAASEGRCQISGSIEEYIRAGFQVCARHADQRKGIMGSLVRDFPTTAAIAVTLPGENCVELLVGWAGDSRVYLLDEAGLAQLTVDDVEDPDELSNLTSNAAMTNSLSSDGKWKMTWCRFRIDHPCLVFAATDGCFGFLPTPMDFEYLLLDALRTARNPVELEQELDRRFRAVAGDDYTLAMLSLGFGSYSGTVKSFSDRLKQLEENEMRTLKEAEGANDPETARNIRASVWENYQGNYHRCITEEWRLRHGQR